MRIVIAVEVVVVLLLMAYITNELGQQTKRIEALQRHFSKHFYVEAIGTSGLKICRDGASALDVSTE